jgi:hypothetical protein
MRWQILLQIYWPVAWWHFQPKLFMGWGLMRVTLMQLREFIQQRVGLQIIRS